MQTELLKAERAGNQRRVFGLQDRLLRSEAARRMAVLQVTSNNGKHTPGVDDEIWRNPAQKEAAVRRLADMHDYSAEPARRVYIPKSNGDRRPLGILTMKDRAMQALYQLALDPISELHADPHSYGFRKQRSTADAIARCGEIFASREGPHWVLEADIEACFDSISHAWLMKHIPLPSRVLQSWLKAGYVEKGRFHHVKKGLPQGGIISPTLTNMALDGMEEMLVTYFHHTQQRKAQSKIAFVRYADDFIVAGADEKMLQEDVKSLLANFLKERGMRFSARKTTLTPVKAGFNFLGYHLQASSSLLGGYRLRITPARKSFDKLLAALEAAIGARPEVSAGQLIQVVNPMIRGWTQHYTFVEYHESFAELDEALFRLLLRWGKGRCSGLRKGKAARRYFTQIGKGPPLFCDGNGTQLLCARTLPPTEHRAVSPNCNPYDPAWQAHLKSRNT